MPRNSVQTNYEKTTLYSVVFDGFVVKAVIALLGVFFLLNPVASALASEIESEPEEVEIMLDDGFEEDAAEEEDAIAEIVEEESEEVEEPAAETNLDPDEEDLDQEVLETEVITEEDENPQDPSEESVDVIDETASSTEEVVGDDETEVEETATTTDEMIDETTQQTATSSPPSATSTESHTDIDTGIGGEETSTSTEEVEEQETEEQEDSDEEENDTSADPDPQVQPEEEVLGTATTSESTATSTDRIASSTEEVIVEGVTYVNNALNRYQFAESECRTMGDGTYYCTDGSTLTDVPEDAVYSAPDIDGDLEIFVRIDGEDTQITHNIVDDSAPFYDVISNTIVWQSLINDRYQIVSYDVDDAEATVRTNTSYNNMQPVALGDILFWQAWIGDNWEIVRFEDGDLIQMTDNDVHDIAPYALDDYVMWQTQEGDEWDITLYDLNKDKAQSINSNAPGSSKNPRMVLMYESFDANGDVHMFGYDLRTQEHISLATVPTSLPRELPEPDGNTEKKALINAKPTLREESETEDLVPETEPELPESENPDIADVIIGATSTDAVADEIVGETASTSVSHIEDLVIPTYIGTSTEEVG